MRSFVRHFTILAAFAVAPIGALAAQAAPSPVAVGARVRLTLPEPGPHRFGVIPPERMLVGEVLNITQETLTIRPHPLLPPIDVSRSAVQRLHVSRGVSRWRSAFAGAVGGAVLGVLWGHVLYGFDLRSPSFDTGAHARSRGAIIGAAAVGLTQAVFPHETWRRVR